MSWTPPEADPHLGRVPPEFHGGPGYEPCGQFPPVMADLSTNVNPWLPGDDMQRVIAKSAMDRYPDSLSRRARGRLAAVWQIEAERILLGAGASELIYRVARCWVRPGNCVVVCGPTFGEYRRAVHLQGGRVCEVRGASPGFALPLKRFLDRIHALRPPLAFLCTPNNPTGEALADNAVNALAERMPAGTLLVLDESYQSFARECLAPPHLPESDRVLHIRSFTKDLGVPGLRIAAAIGAPRLLDPLMRIAPPWPVSSVAEAALIAALTPTALDRLARTLHRIRLRRTALAEALSLRGWHPLPSATNFLLATVPAAAHTVHALRLRGIRVRHAASFGLPDQIRVAVRPRTEEALFLAALDTRIAQAGHSSGNRSSTEQEPIAP